MSARILSMAQRLELIEEKVNPFSLRLFTLKELENGAWSLEERRDDATIKWGTFDALEGVTGLLHALENNAHRGPSMTLRLNRSGASYETQA